MKKLAAVTIVILLLCAMVSAGEAWPVYPRIGRSLGVGARGASLANNFTALSNDISALYWNPAGLAFLPVREFQITIDGFRMHYDASIGTITTRDHHERMRFTNSGLMAAVPTQVGGFTLAGAYQNPFVFDDISGFSGSVIRDGSEVNLKSNYSTSGGLRMWSGGFGVQVAPNLGAGVTASLVGGREDLRSSLTTKDGSGSVTDTVQNVNAKYFGYDLRAGLMYVHDDLFRLGARVVFPQVIRFEEEVRGSDNGDRYRFESSGRLYSPLSGSVGGALTLPVITVTAEGRYTFPYTYIFPNDDIPKNSQAAHFNTGAGAGVEVPLYVVPVILRAGYSYDKYNLFPYVAVYGDNDRTWEDVDVDDVHKNLQTISGGVAIVTHKTAFELGYVLQTWGRRTESVSGQGLLEQDYKDHRVIATFSVRY